MYMRNAVRVRKFLRYCDIETGNDNHGGCLFDNDQQIMESSLPHDLERVPASLEVHYSWNARSCTMLLSFTPARGENQSILC
jgi:hypothetical protein